MLENRVKIKEGHYIVRTQAGYRNVVKDVWGTLKQRETYYINKTPFPKQYPAYVILRSEYIGGFDNMVLISLSLNEIETISQRMKNPLQV